LDGWFDQPFWFASAARHRPRNTAAGFAVLSWRGSDPSYRSGVLAGLIVVSIGMTIAIAPLTTTVFDSAPDAMSGIASGINNAAARAASLVAIAALGLAFGTTTSPGADGLVLASAYPGRNGRCGRPREPECDHGRTDDRPAESRIGSTLAGAIAEPCRTTRRVEINRLLGQPAIRY
jgi:hypothetical protein